MYFFHGCGRDSKVLWTPNMSGYLMYLIIENQDFKGALRMVSNIQHGQKKRQNCDFQRSWPSEYNFSRLWEKLKVLWTPYLTKPIRDNVDFQEALRKANNVQKKPKNSEKGDFQRRQRPLFTFVKVMGDTKKNTCQGT